MQTTDHAQSRATPAGAAHRRMDEMLALGAFAFTLGMLADATKVIDVVLAAPMTLPSLVIETEWLAISYLLPVLAYVAVSAVACAVPPNGQVRLLHAAAAVGLVVAACGMLAAYSPFRTFWPAFVGLALVLGGLVGAFELASRASRRARASLGALALAACACLVISDRTVYPGLYATLYLAWLMLLPAAAFWCLRALPQATGPWALRSVRSLGVASVALGVVSVIAHDDASDAHAVVRARTVLGQAPEAVDGSALAERGNVIALDTGPWAETYFAARSGLPALPAGFRLADHDVLFISIEATRFDRTSLARRDLDTTPNLKRFATHGAHWFTRAYAPSSGTLHSISSIMTMSFPSAIALTASARPWWGHLGAEEVTVDELMRDAGRATFWASHDVDEVFSRGRIGGFGAGIDPAHIHRARDVPDADEAIVDFALAEIRAARDAGRRYFGWVFLPAPHAPYHAHEPDDPSGTDEARYLSELRYMDRQLGRIFEALEAVSALEDTVVIVTGDHGEEFRDHGGERHKSTVYEEVTHVPLVVYVPGATGVRQARPTSVAYVFPWLLARGESGLRARDRADRAAPGADDAGHARRRGHRAHRS